MMLSGKTLTELYAGLGDGYFLRLQRAARLGIVALLTLFYLFLGLIFFGLFPFMARSWPGFFISSKAPAGYLYVIFTLAFVPLLFWALVSAVGQLSLYPLFVNRSTRAFGRALLGAVVAGDVAVVMPALASEQSGEIGAEPITLRGLSHPTFGRTWRSVLPSFLWGVLWLGMGLIDVNLAAHSWNYRVSLGLPLMADNAQFIFELASSAWSELFSGLIGITLSVLLLWFYLRVDAGFDCVVDAEGMTLRPARGFGAPRRIRWRDARGFACITLAKETRDSLAGVTYILDAGKERLLWFEPRQAEQAATTQDTLRGRQREVAQRLAIQVERHTGLTLYDVTDAVSAAFAEQPQGRYQTVNWNLAECAFAIAQADGDADLADALLARLRPAGRFSRVQGRGAAVRSVRTMTTAAREALLTLARALLPYYPYPAWPEGPIPQAPLSGWRRLTAGAGQAFVRVGAVVVLIASLLPFAGAFTSNITDLVYTPMLTTLSGQVATEQPLYRASLKSPTPGWPILAETPTDPNSTHFGPDGYTVAQDQKNQNLIGWFAVWNPQTSAPRDLALTVQVALQPPSASDPYVEVEQAGIIVTTGADRAHAIRFEVSSAGNWDLSGCYSYKGSGPIICQDELIGIGATNLAPIVHSPSGLEDFTLLLIRSGRTYFCYINGHYLGDAHDDLTPAITSGQVGFYNEGGVPTATFSNLAIYPAPDGLPFWAR